MPDDQVCPMCHLPLEGEDDSQSIGAWRGRLDYSQLKRKVAEEELERLRTAFMAADSILRDAMWPPDA